MGMTVRMLCGCLVVAALAWAGLLWFQRVYVGTPEEPAIKDVLKEKFQTVTGMTEEGSVETDAEVLEIVSDETVAATRVTGDAPSSREDASPDPGQVLQKDDLVKLRADVRREISRRRGAAYKELRPLEQSVFRLKNESSGLRPRKPSANARRRVQEQYERDLDAYLASNQRIERELQEATVGRDKAAAVYAKLKEDSGRALRGEADELRELAAAYGVSIPKQTDRE